MSGRRKLIEVALPLDAINVACKADKDRKTGTIRNLHKWFAPMPPPAWRALLFAALVDDPEDDDERERLLALIARLVESGGDVPSAAVLADAKREIDRCWPEGPPPILDPFCGGGSTLVEAQRFGCRTIGSDLNPVPVLISKVLTEMLPQVAAEPAVVGDSERMQVGGGPHQGVAADVVAVAEEINERVAQRLADLYPSPADSGQAVAWLWCRTVKCPNPACGVDAPLVDSLWLSKKKGHQRHLAISFAGTRAEFSVASGAPGEPTGTVSRSGAICAACGVAIPFEHVRSEGLDGRLGARLMATVSKRGNERAFLPGTIDEECLGLDTGDVDVPAGHSDLAINQKGLGIRVPLYGIDTFARLFLPRQLALLSAFADEVSRVREDLVGRGASDDHALAVAAILALCVGKLAQANSTQVRWKIDSRSGTGKVEAALGEHTLPMTWDWAEANAVEDVAGSWLQVVRTAVRALPYAPTGTGSVALHDARTAGRQASGAVLCATDPPYFDQIGYADLSDYFYLWLRRALRGALPDLFATVSVPKEAELVAVPSRSDGDADVARQAFVDGFTETFTSLSESQTEGAPMLVVYAFKEQKPRIGDGVIAPGWEAILEAMIAAGLTIVGTWPIHGTGSTRMISMGTNALATYVVLAVRPRPADARRITRSDLTRMLRAELGSAVADLQRASIAPVDLAQAVIGPGMAIYSRHVEVVETDGSRVGVAQALGLINRTLGEILDEQEGDLDPDSRWAATWYEQHGFATATFGEADRLARPKGIAVDSLVEAGIVTSVANKVALIKRGNLAEEWDPQTDSRPTAWEAVHYLLRALLDRGGEEEAARLYVRLGSLADPARELAYRLFQIADRTNRKEDAMAYNGLVASWSEIARLAASLPNEPMGFGAPEELF